MSVFIIFLIVLSVLVLIHEAGHYFAARLFKVKAEEFGWGFPPRVIGIVKKDGKWKLVRRHDEEQYEKTIWSVNWLPIGGFVRIKGENPDEETEDKDSFQNIPIWKRIIILSAGVVMNWFLAFILFAAIFMIGAPAMLEDVPAGAIITDQKVHITHTLANEPAEQAGLEVGDEVLSIAGTKPDNYDQAIELIGAQGEQPFEMVIRRDDLEQSFTVTPSYIAQLDKFGIGVAVADIGIVHFKWYQSLWEAGRATYGYTKAVIFAFGGMLRDLVLLRGLQDDIAGPVGIAVITGQMAKQGIVALLQFTAILSINLAVINFLPIPALDGGRVIFLAFEKLRGRAIRPKVEATIHQVAFFALIILVLLVTLRDIGRYSGPLIGGIRGLIGI